MFARRQPKASSRHEKLLYAASLRQMETSSKNLHNAYDRLIEAASVANARDLYTVILDWFETEIAALQDGGENADADLSEFLRAVVALSNILRQQ